MMPIGICRSLAYSCRRDRNHRSKFCQLRYAIRLLIRGKCRTSWGRCSCQISLRFVPSGIVYKTALVIRINITTLQGRKSSYKNVNAYCISIGDMSSWHGTGAMFFKARQCVVETLIWSPELCPCMEDDLLFYISSDAETLVLLC
jgi:hypothetical protein